MYYVLTSYWPAEYGYADIHGIDPVDVPGINPGLGRPLPPDFPEITYVVGDLSSLPSFFWAGIHLLMNQTAVEAVERSGETHFELWPARVVDLGGDEDRISYQRVHLLDDVSCFDSERSDFETDPWDETGILIGHVRKLVLDEGRIPPDRHLFRMREYPIDLVSQRLRDHFIEAGFSPLTFQPIDEYDSEKSYWPEPT